MTDGRENAQMQLFAEPPPAQTLAARPLEEARAALVGHNGDAVATIATLIEECAFLRSELAAAELLLSKGYGRGWVPRFVR